MAPVLKTGGRKPLQVRILCPPSTPKIYRKSGGPQDDRTTRDAVSPGGPGKASPYGPRRVRPPHDSLESPDGTRHLRRGAGGRRLRAVEPTPRLALAGEPRPRHQLARRQPRWHARPGASD